MEKVIVVVKEKNKCVAPCEHFPDKMIGSEKCRGCKFHKKHNRANSKVICSYTPEGYISDMDEFQRIFKKEE